MPLLTQNPLMAVVNAVPLKPDAKVDAKHPFQNEKNHQKLIQWLRAKLKGDLYHRNNRCHRFATIDKGVSGWITEYSDGDKDRKARQNRTGEPAAVKHNLSLTQVHLDDLVAYYLEIFMPTRGMFYALGAPDKIKKANEMAALLSSYAHHTKRLKQMNRFFMNCMKYNLGGIHTYWRQELGTAVYNGSDGKLKTEDNAIVWEGNDVDSVDMYNFFYDPSVDIVDLYKEGEWCAEAELKSHFHLYQQNAAGKYQNFGTILETEANNVYYFYKSPPRAAGMDQQGISGESNYLELWLGNTTQKDSGSLVELVTIHAWVNPKLFGLSNQAGYKLYKFIIAAGRQVISITELNNIHGKLPYNFARPLDDQMKGNQKSIGEILTPLQDFASFCLNTHVEGVRSQIYGTRIFNSAFVDVDAIPPGEVNANIPTKPGAKAVPLNQIAMKLDSTVDTSQLMQSMNAAFDLANSMFPAMQMPSQVAGIDRAINSQVAAALQGANKRAKKYGRVLVDQCLEPSKVMQIKNVQQFFRDGTVNGPHGQQTVITASDLREEDITTQIGHGLMTLDREKMVNDLREIYFSTVQSQAAAQQIDIVGLLGAMLDLMDYHLDVNDFRIKPEQQQGNKNVPQGVPQGAGQPQPVATNPAAQGG